MGIATAYAPYVDFAINGANENEARSGEALTVVGTITAGSDADGAYLSSAGSANYLKIPDQKLDRQLRSAGHMWVGKIKTTISGAFAVLAGVVEGPTNPSASIEYVAINLSNIEGTVLNGCLSFYYRSNTDTTKKCVVRTAAIGINDGNDHSFCIKQIKDTDTFDIWVDGVQRSLTYSWDVGGSTVTTTAGTLAREFFVFARNDNGNPANYFPGQIYTLARIKSSDFSAEALSTDPSIIFDAAAGAFASTISVTDALKNNTGTVLASQSGIKVAVLKADDLESVYEATATTNASGILSDITNAAIVAGAYHVAIKLTDGSVGITGAIEAV